MVEVIDTPDHDRTQVRAIPIIVAGPIDWLESRVANFLTRLSIALTLTGVGLVAVTLFQVRFGLLPLRRIEQGLAEVRSGEASKLEGELPAEIEPLQVELNALILSNQDIIDRARTQVGNLAHALEDAARGHHQRGARGQERARGQGRRAGRRSCATRCNHYLDRARVAARVGVIGRSTSVASVIEPLVRALERIHRDRDIAHHRSMPGRGCALPGRTPGPRGDARQSARQRLQVGQASVCTLTVSVGADPQGCRAGGA